MSEKKEKEPLLYPSWMEIAPLAYIVWGTRINHTLLERTLAPSHVLIVTYTKGLQVLGSVW